MTKNEMKLLRITKVSSDWLWPDTHQTSFIVPYTRCICIHRKTVLSIRISGKKGETCIAIADRLNTMAQDILFSNSFDLWQSDSCSYLVWHCHWFNFFSVVKYSWSFFLTSRHFIVIIMQRFNSVHLHDTLPVDLPDLWPPTFCF